jgi:hypothetical protein
MSFDPEGPGACKGGRCNSYALCRDKGCCRYKSSAEERAEWLKKQEEGKQNMIPAPFKRLRPMGVLSVSEAPPFSGPMTQEQVQKVMETVFEECRQLRGAGQLEYAHNGENAFANFERAGRDLDLEREKVLWIFAMKHRDGIASYLKGHTSQREDVRGRINDLIVYLVLLRGMLDERANSLTRPDLRIEK